MMSRMIEKVADAAAKLRARMAAWSKFRATQHAHPIRLTKTQQAALDQGHCIELTVTKRGRWKVKVLPEQESANERELYR